MSDEGFPQRLLGFGDVRRPHTIAGICSVLKGTEEKTTVIERGRFLFGVSEKISLSLSHLLAHTNTQAQIIHSSGWDASLIGCQDNSPT